jgi:hypothetical protein
MYIRYKKGVSIILIILMVVGGLSGSFIKGELARAEVAFAGGAGTIGNPYLIATPEQLNEVRYHVDPATHFKLINDIDFENYVYPDGNEGWLPIAHYTGNKHFKGSFNGNGFKIKNLMMNRPTITYAGMFGLNIGTITDVFLENVHMTSSSGASGLIGYNFGTINNSTVTGTVYGLLTNTGGMVGINYGTIKNSSSAANVYGAGAQTGGLSGSNDTGGSYIGKIINSYATGNVDGVGGYVGGLVGINKGVGPYISNSYATGNVSGSLRIGGLVGDNRAPINNSYATGYASGPKDIGGLAGHNISSISNSYARGDVSGSNFNVGGLVGFNTGIGSISNSYATGSVSGTTIDVGGLIGLNNGTGAVDNSFYDSQTTGQLDSGMGRLTEDMMESSTFSDANWDFANIWGIQSARNNGYPYLYELPSTAIDAVTAPVTGETPISFITSNEYTASVVWSDAPSTFAASTMYTATITLAPKTGYTLTGISENYFIVDGATATNAANSGVITAIFPATLVTTIATAAISGVTIPVKGETPVAAIAETTAYTATITWTDAPSTFAAGTIYTATITLTPKTGYTLTGVSENFFIVDGATATNAANAGVITAIFPATEALSTNATLTSIIGIVSANGTASETITSIPRETTLDALRLAITPAPNATFEIYNADGTTLATTLATGRKVIVTAEDTLTKVIYTLTMRSVPPSDDLPLPTTVLATVPTTVPTITSSDGSITLPVGRPGNVSLEDDVTVTIPAGATNIEMQLTIAKVLNTQSLLMNREVLASPIYEILKNFSESFIKPVTLTFVFDPASVNNNERAAVFYYDEEKNIWVEIGGKVSGNKITVEVDHFTKFAVMVVGQTVDVPIAETTTAVSFSDISGHWAEANIRQAVSSGIVNGYLDDTFKPGNTVTRAEFSVMLMNAWKAQGEGSELTFTDSAKIGAWARKAVAQAVQAGIIAGFTDGTFGPKVEITRAEMATMVAKALGQPIEPSATTGFTDDKNIPVWAKGSIAYMNQTGIMRGKGNNVFAPRDHATRAEAITVILNALNK